MKAIELAQNESLCGVININNSYRYLSRELPIGPGSKCEL